MPIMEFHVSFKVNPNIYLKDPEVTELGKQIVKKAIDLMFTLGYEQFTFKKLAVEVNTTEATLYRYFENKQRLLLYILNWYWCYMEFLVDFKLQNLDDKKQKLDTIVRLFTEELPESSGQFDYNKKYLNQIVIRESSKSYMIKDVREMNKEQVFKPYKDLSNRIAEIIKEYNPHYQYPKSLSTTIIETSHNQQYFVENLPRLTDIGTHSNPNFTADFLSDLLIRVLD